ncbi:hypothetical protein EDC04DRAFT_2900835 [Pisolithus marmoratus]|nr:hypothetical protein EDC04DRAFT_2900835 [Pisolithus marmoratus]
MRKATEHFDSVLMMSGWNVPCLGLTIIGHYVTFYAMIFVHRWRIVSLTPGLSCIRTSGDGDDRIALYNTFTAASVLLARIQDDAAKLPTPSSLRYTHGFKIIELFHFPAADRYLYIAETADSKQIMIKFIRRYSYKLHMFCADRGCAPALLGFERLPGGFFGIATEFVQFAFPISQSPYVEKHREWTEQLWKLVESCHTEGLVHGDLRAPNIICDQNRVMLIDFDWAGKEGEVSYPHGSLNADLMIGRDNPDLKITKGDDLRVLEKTLKYVYLTSHGNVACTGSV